MNYHKRLVMTGLGVLILAVASIFLFRHFGEEKPIVAGLGRYGKLSTYCGVGQIPMNPSAIKRFGCFYLSPEHSTIGTFADHRVEAAVGANGREVFAVDGTLVQDVERRKQEASGTNLPFVYRGGVDGYRICHGASGDGCATDIMVFSRNSDKSVLFVVDECLPPSFNVCVQSQESWDYQMSLRNSD
jgi:hypothetical protein